VQDFRIHTYRLQYLPLPLLFAFNFYTVADSATLMASEQITASAPEERGVGGKLRKPATRKSLPSPYARPPEATRQRWISKLVDPALRLIAGGATRLLPSIFSAAPSPSPVLCPTSAAEDQGYIPFFFLYFFPLIFCSVLLFVLHS